jgi:hypothetical protein
MDKAHVAEPPPTWVPGYWRIQWTEWVDGYWVNPTTGTNLTEIIVQQGIDAGTALLYDNKENIFWIGDSTGPFRSMIYGPYSGIMWELTKAIDPLAILGMILSTIALLYPVMGRALRHNIEGIQLFRNRK